MSQAGGAVVPPRAAIVTIGDELLVGDRADTNGAWLARRLTERGFRVITILSVGDGEEEIGAALARAAEAAELVVATGGLGPTGDDRTREAVARRWGLPLTEDPELVEELRRRYRARGRTRLPANTRSQARVPGGAEAIPGVGGTAPALRLVVPSSGGAGEEGGTTTDLVLLPGVPEEMTGYLDGSVGDRLRERFGTRLRPRPYRILRTTGIPESELAERIEAERSDGGAVSVAYRPSRLGVELRLDAEDPQDEEVLGAFENELRGLLAGYLWDDPSGDLAGAAGRALERRGLTVGVAESCTGGLVLERLTEIPGSSAWVLGGIVAYADSVKTERLGVARALLDTHGAVSAQVARALAESVARILGAEVGVGVTGIAGPGGAVPGKPVGTVWLAIAGPAGTRVEHRRFPGDRREVRDRAAQGALHLVLRAVEETEAPGGGAPESPNPGRSGG